MRTPQPEFDAEEQQLALALNAGQNTHPPLDMLQAAGQEVLPPDVEVRVSAHLAECALCRGLIADFTTLPETPLSFAEQGRIEAKLPLQSSTPSAKGGRAWMGIAAAVVIMLCGAVAWRSYTHNKAETQNAQVAAPIVDSSKSMTASLEIPLTPLAPPHGATLLTRGTESLEPATEQLLPAFIAYNRGDYGNAAKDFSTLAASYPKSETVSLYLGVSQLFLDQNDAADTSLSRALSLAAKDIDTKNADAARWYGAIAATRLHAPRAATLLHELCNEPASPYSAQSCKLLGVSK